MVKSYLFPLKVKWKNSIRKTRTLNPKRVQKVIPRIPEIGNPIPEKEETNRIFKKFFLYSFLREN